MDETYSAFNPDAFLHMEQTEVNTRRNPLDIANPASPDGLYIALIGEPKRDSGMIDKEGPKKGEPWLSFNIPLTIDVPQELQAKSNLPPQLTLYDRVFIDLTPGGKGIDNTPGKNRGQKAYRDALGMNVEGQSFSWARVQGRPIKLQIGWKMAEANGESFPVEEIKGRFKA